MTAACEWVIEFRDDSGFNAYVRATTPQGKNTIASAKEWQMLAEGSYKECQGNVRAGTMAPRPLESCVKRVAKIVHKKHENLSLQVRIRNVNNDEKIMGDLFI